MKKWKEVLLALVKANHSPHEIALGVSIGVFVGMCPLYGLHTLIVIFLAFVLKRVNKIAMFLGTGVSIPPLVPFVAWGGYKIGRLMLGNGSHELPDSFFENFSYQNLKDIFYPFFVGSIVLGAVTALISYFITAFFARRLVDIRKAHSHE